MLCLLQKVTEFPGFFDTYFLEDWQIIKMANFRFMTGLSQDIVYLFSKLENVISRTYSMVAWVLTQSKSLQCIQSEKISVTMKTRYRSFHKMHPTMILFQFLKTCFPIRLTTHQQPTQTARFCIQVIT